MAHYNATVTSPRPPDEVFAYLADFRSVAEWDPSISESVQLDGGDPVAVGATFRVTSRTRLRDVVLEYRTVELEPPRTILLRGENGAMVSIDRITVTPDAGGGSAVTYDAELELKGAFKLADPLLALGFRRVGDKARDGLAAKLNETPTRA